MAPGEGVQLRGHSIIVVTHDVILRHLRLRLGDALLTSAEAEGRRSADPQRRRKNTYNVVLDHMSLLWGTDIGGLAILGNVHDVTVQNSIIGEGLYLSRQPSSQTAEGHSMGANVTPMVPGQTPPTAAHLLPQSVHDLRPAHATPEGASCVDLVNNLIYNWGIHAATGNPRSSNIVANWFRRGRASTRTTTGCPARQRGAQPLPHLGLHPRQRMDGFSGHRHANAVVYAASARCGGLSVHASPVPTVLNSVLTNVGAKLPVRRRDRPARHLQRAKSGRTVLQRRGLCRAAPVLADVVAVLAVELQVGGSDSHVGPVAHRPASASPCSATRPSADSRWPPRRGSRRELSSC